MSTQNVYFTDPSTLTRIDTNVSSIISNNTIQFKKGNVGDLSKLVPDYEWEWRKLTARAFRHAVLFGSQQGVPTNDFWATHISSRVPTGWKNGYVFTGPIGPATGFVWKFTLPGTETAYDTTNNLRDLVGGYLEDGTFSYAANMNKKVLLPPRGSYFDEVTASCLLRVDFSKPFDPTSAVAHIDYVLGTGSNIGQTWMKNNGVVVFGAAYTVHRPFYLQDPRCHSVCHLHGSSENASLLSNGIYPFNQELMLGTVHADYLDYDGFAVDLGPPLWTGGPPFGTKVSENYNLFMSEWNSQTTNTGTAVGFFPNPLTYSWYNKMVYVLKHHGLLNFGISPNDVTFLGPFMCNHLQSQSNALNSFADVIKEQFLYPPVYDSTGYNLSTLKPTFVSPELSSYLSTTGTNLTFRAINGGTIKTFLKHTELDAWYSSNTGGYNTAWGGWQAWGVCDPTISAQYNAMK